MADSFLSFLHSAATGIVMYGQILAKPEVVALRQKICAECPLNRDGRCQDTVVDGTMLAGCTCPIKPKTLAAASVCPQGKWSSDLPKEK